MNHQKIYNSIIKKAQKEFRKKYQGIYYEKHHIIPRCCGGSVEPTNLVLLTAKEHFIVHLLLTKIYRNNKKLWYALWRMQHSVQTGGHYKTSILYAKIREEVSNDISKRFSGKNASMYCKTVYDVWVEKYGVEEADIRYEKYYNEQLSLSLKERLIKVHGEMEGLKKFKEYCNIISKKNSGVNNWNYGKHVDPEKKKQHSERMKKYYIGEKNPMYGKSFYEVWIEKYGIKKADKMLKQYSDNMAESVKGENNGFYGKTHSDEQKEKWSAIRGKKYKLTDPQGNIIEGVSLRKMCKEYKLDRHSLKKYMNKGIIPSPKHSTRELVLNTVGWQIEELEK